MKALRMLGFAVLLTVFALAGCSQKSGQDSAAKIYDIKGKVVAIRPDREGVTLDHEDIPGLMKGMKMEFLVEDARVLEGLEVGDQVQGKLKVESGSQMITELKKR
jgi:Cu/Ag efflux protein CusF